MSKIEYENTLVSTAVSNTEKLTADKAASIHTTQAFSSDKVIEMDAKANSECQLLDASNSQSDNPAAQVCDPSICVVSDIHATTPLPNMESASICEEFKDNLSESSSSDSTRFGRRRVRKRDGPHQPMCHSSKTIYQPPEMIVRRQPVRSPTRQFIHVPHHQPKLQTMLGHTGVAVTALLTAIRHDMLDLWMSTVALAKQQFEQEPSVKMFVYTAGALSAIPVGIFTLYAAVTLFVSLMTAALGVLLIGGSLVMIGLGVLIPIEGVVLIVATSVASVVWLIQGPRKVRPIAQNHRHAHQGKLLGRNDGRTSGHGGTVRRRLRNASARRS
ncbi:hypothetical protein BATDEDRAFT_92255 [Batrachochytrium dendrobatidis JAM81]|uniref:Transmembrane protein n=2 Tax=Batrachochytrium dendrobatidis TaxID=109871 RepID=F4PCY2_BATDJ|nr:uncharacterized protein BATDEDRAFT_92255 [Batrachochytrium dendrobatidis JAM81]EGF76940.1 hypothetical protein BATDEDRAFT_92255 [Batrachochytrium dendrobatidis JAM81]OAJ45056.1 hypothetical protein BDEG_28224 [Batrachochytrium dendrobatidis JEL423]|eukprot:XP_006682511.1 hypothetical protein BATDEDRAFT_92255 [Batrachochytrium dendrobatidis JAM81]